MNALELAVESGHHEETGYTPDHAKLALMDHHATFSN